MDGLFYNQFSSFIGFRKAGPDFYFICTSVLYAGNNDGDWIPAESPGQEHPEKIPVFYDAG